MSNFWNLSDNSNAGATGGEFETGGGVIEPIPANTSCLAAIDEAKIDEYDGDQYISLRWTILQPEAYKNRKVFHKVRVWDVDPSKADKAKRMLAAIDTNAGGKLMEGGEEPSDLNMTMALVNKPMVIKLQVWELDTDNGLKSGNWVCAVSPRSSGTAAPSAPEAPAKPEEDVPF